MKDKTKRIIIYDVALPLLFIIIVMAVFIVLKVKNDDNGSFSNSSVNDIIDYDDYIQPADYQLNRRILGVMINEINITPQIDFFMEAFDPVSNLVEEELFYVYQLLGDNVTFYPRYIIRKNGENNTYCEDKGSFCSSRGLGELHQGIRELCAYYYLGPTEYFDFAVATNLLCNSDNVDDCWYEAANLAKIDFEEINRCYREENRSIMRDERIVARSMNLTSVGVFINGKPYEGPINQVAFFEALCAEFNPNILFVCETKTI